MTKSRRLVSATLAFSVLLSSVEAATQQPPPPSTSTTEPKEGLERFQRGVVLFREGDFRAALVEFRRSYQLTSNFKVLYNIGQTEFELQEYASALRSFKKYLEAAGSQIDAARRSEVEESITSLGARVAYLDITCNVAGAEVLIDDVVVGRTPLTEAVLVSVGRRKVLAQKDGIATAARFIDLAGGDRTPVKLELAAAEPVPQVTAAATTSAGPVASTKATAAPLVAEDSNPQTGLWVSLGVTGALALGTGVLGGLALLAHGDAEKTVGTFGATAAEIKDARSKTQSLAIVADILGGATIAMATVSIILGVRASGKSNTSATKLHVGPARIGISGSF